MSRSIRSGPILPLDEPTSAFGNSSLGPQADSDVYETNVDEMENLTVWDLFEAVGPNEVVDEFDLLTSSRKCLTFAVTA
jgi:hypothetical protein